MLKFTEENHQYTCNGSKSISVTQVINAIGIRDSNGHYNSLTGVEFMNNENSCVFGKEFHKVAYYDMQGKKCTFDPALTDWVCGYKKLKTDIFDKIKYDKILLEKPMYSKIYKFAGTPDVVFIIGKTAKIYDYKTSVSNQKSWKWQLAAYAQLVSENYNISMSRIEICSARIFENGYDLTTHRGMKVKCSWNYFLSLLSVLNGAEK